MSIKSCKKASRLMSDSFERRLSLKENISLNIHLMMCKGCTLAFKQLKGLRKLFPEYSKGILNTKIPQNKSLSQEVKEKIKSKLKNL